MSEISYEMVMQVTTSWDSLKSKPKSREVLGERIFVGLFEIEPNAMELYNLQTASDVRSHPRFLAAARTMVDMIDAAVGFLGPDLDLLSDDLLRLGKRHRHYGVKPPYFVAMGLALFAALQEVLGPRFSDHYRQAWNKVYNFMASKMIEGMTA